MIIVPLSHLPHSTPPCSSQGRPGKQPRLILPTPCKVPCGSGLSSPCPARSPCDMPFPLDPFPLTTLELPCLLPLCSLLGAPCVPCGRGGGAGGLRGGQETVVPWILLLQSQGDVTSLEGTSVVTLSKGAIPSSSGVFLKRNL